MAAAFSSSTATARMTVEGAPVWDLATLMPDGAVGASASGGRAVVLAQAFADEHRGRIGGFAAGDGETATLTEAVTLLSSDDRAMRRRAAESITGGLEVDLRTRASILDTLLNDHSVDDRLRRFPHWLARLNLDNEAADASVAALVDAASSSGRPR